MLKFYSILLLCVVCNDQPTNLLAGPNKSKVVKNHNSRLQARPVNNPPQEILLSPYEIQEGQPPGTLIGYFTTVDPDENDPYHYSLVAGEGDSGNSYFKIMENRLISEITFDYEKQNEYYIRVRSTDSSGLYTEAQLIVTVAPDGSLPQQLILCADQVEENQPPNTFVSFLVKSGQHITEQLSYRLVRGEGDRDNDAFHIVDDMLLTGRTFNYEQQHIYRIRLQVKNQEDSVYSEAFVVEVLDVNDVPTDILLSADTLTDSMPPGTLVGELNTSDEDVWDHHRYRLVKGEGDRHNHLFRIEDNQLQIDKPLNYNAVHTLNIRIRSTDSLGAWIEKKFRVTYIPDADIHIPTAFTPNGDHQNDRWEIGKLWLYPEAEVEIFNRLGERVFYSQAYYDAWDGTYRGNLLPADSYFYIIRIPSINQVFSGSLLIINE